jgi:hypothetical protein
VTTRPVSTSPVTAPQTVPPRVFGPGAVTLLEPGPEDQPRLRQSAVRRQALAAVDAATARAEMELVFGIYEDPGTLTEPGGTVVALPRPVWVARFSDVQRRRASNIPERRRSTSSVPPTTSRELLTEVVVVIDDRSGRVLLRSEYASTG